MKEKNANIYAIHISNHWIGGNDVRLYVAIDLNNCDGGSYVNYDIEWIIDDSIAQTSNITQGNKLFIPAGTLTVGEEYTFTVSAIPDSSLLTSSFDSVIASIITTDYDLIAKIQGGTTQVHLVSNGITLDAQSLSYDYQAAGGNTDDLTFAWECDEYDANGCIDTTPRSIMDSNLTSNFQHLNQQI